MTSGAENRRFLPQVIDLVAEIMLEHMIKYACANLLTLLGASLTVKPNPAYIASHLDPNEWKDGKVRGIIQKTDLSNGGLLVEFEVIVAT